MGLLYQRYMTDGYEGLVKCCQGETEVLGEGPTPKIPHNTMGLNRDFRVRKQRPTPSAMEQSTN